MKPEFISIAAYLENSAGHFYHYHLSMQKALKDLVEFRLVLPRNHTLPTLPESWDPWFTNTKKKKGTFLEYCRLFSSSQKKRIFFLEYFQRRDFIRFTLAALLKSSKKDSLWLFYRDNFIKKRKKEKWIIQVCSFLLLKRFSSRLVILTDTEQLQKFYNQQFSQPIYLLPINHAPFYYQRKRKQKIVLSWLGTPRKEKGLDTILSLLQLKDPYAKEFLLQFSKNLHAFATNDLEIKKLEPVLSANSYTHALLESDCILLPYDPNRYEYSSSGIFVEAIAAGKIPLVNHNTWPAFELKKYDLEELILDWTLPTLYQKIHELACSPIIRKKLLKMQQNYICFHNSVNFKNALVSLLKLN